MVYGSTVAEEKQLRTGIGGKSCFYCLGYLDGEI
jgi:hypothetical protein